MSFLAFFDPLDELIQIIYQGIERFTVLSKLNDDAWTVHLGLEGEEGRWWRGRWEEGDAEGAVGKGKHDRDAEKFAEKLAEWFVGGDLYVAGWKTQKGADIKLTFGASSGQPVHVPLVELSAAEAASYATSVFLTIALQAKPRQCRLQADSIAPYTAPPIPISPPRFAASATVKSPRKPSPPPIASSSSPAASKRPPASRSEKPTSTGEPSPAKPLMKAVPEKRRKAMEAEEQKKTKQPQPMKGASLANPNKKARKYRALEFASDDE